MIPGLSASPCLWKQLLWKQLWKQADAGDRIFWETSCDAAFVIEEGAPNEHGYRYCPSCGRPILTKGDALDALDLALGLAIDDAGTSTWDDASLEDTEEET